MRLSIAWPPQVTRSLHSHETIRYEAGSPLSWTQMAAVLI